MSFSNTVDAVGSRHLLWRGGLRVARSPARSIWGCAAGEMWSAMSCVSATAAAGATIIGVACLIADHSIAWSEYKSSALSWFLGDAIGLVGIAPFLLVHVFPHVRSWLSPDAAAVPPSQSGPPPYRRLLLERSRKLCGQALTMSAILRVMFGTEDGRYDHFYLCFIPIIWIAMRQGVRRVVTGLLALNFGIVVAMHLFPPTAAMFAKVALLMLVLSAVGLIVGSEVSERHRLAIDLNEQTTYLDLADTK